MAEIKHRQTNGSPEIEYAEIYIPDDRVLGTGSFKTVIKPGGLSKEKVVSSIMINVPVFQISVNLNSATGEIPVLLGRADGSDATSSKIFLLSPNINLVDSHEFEVEFKDWEIRGLSMDGITLREKMEGQLPLGVPIPEHLGSLILTIPDPYHPKAVQDRILDSIFDLSRYFTFYQVKQGNTEINIYRNTDFQILYHHYNPTFGERELTIDFADAEREGARAFFLGASWSAS